MEKITVTETKHLTLARKTIGYKTTESWMTIPHVTFIYEADITGIMEEFRNLNEMNPSEKITLNTLLLKICVEAIKAAPHVNAHMKYNAKYVTGEIQIIKNINISMPWILQNGEMITINLRNFESKTLREMQRYIKTVAEKMGNCDTNIPLYQACMDNMLSELKKGYFLKAARAIIGTFIGSSKISKYDKKSKKSYNQMPYEDKITMQDLLPGTVTISNMGSVYKEQKGFIGILEIIPPQVFAIGIGSVQEKVGIIKNQKDEKQISIREILPICLAFDHRALDFGEIVPFMRKLDYIFEHPKLLYQWYDE